ncbi:tyrosyl-tRNA synthetase [Saccharata proteae CBS 121410]|uniref:Tyrosine--tRNA ligase n=1 Tax=Saccharata proteae CBS 121410 TaxID=1314787 RepID=A0A9P4LSF2_9PEZI|nr:tyrosyl-tRNA synthetase [Saccharata proteae CBS 121410]
MSQKGQKRIEEAQKAWQDKAVEINQGKKQSTLSFLEERGYVNQLAGDRDVIDRLLTARRTGIYCGIDPTAPSLHVGHLLPFMVIFWLYLRGYKAFTLVGSTTAKIGDPTGRTEARQAIHRQEQVQHGKAMSDQVKKLWNSAERMGKKYGLEVQDGARRGVENNSVWLQKVPLMEFLKTMGRSVRLGPMLSRDTVKLRQESGDGMSFAEFTYPLMQAWDWWELYQRYGVQLQIGGSDQFGNIVAGIDAVNRVLKSTEDKMLSLYGLTTPLLTNASGQKLGKSAGNAVWLSQELTNQFDLYGYFVRFADSDVERYLKLFTFMPTSEITSIMEEHDRDPRKRVAQHRLAHEFVEFVHSKKAADEAEEQHRTLFGAESKPGVDKQPKDLLDEWEKNSAIVRILPRSLVYNRPFPWVLWSAGLALSKTNAVAMITNGGAYVGSLPEGLTGEIKYDRISKELTEHETTSKPENYILDGDRLLLRYGKTNVRLVKVISDEEFRERGLDAPGWERLESAQRR